MVKQLSVFVENKQGRLAAVVDLLSSYGINIYALSVADTPDFGILRMIVNDSEKAIEVLSQGKVIASLTDVVIASISNQPGGLAHVLWILAGAGINIEYLYAFVAPSNDGAYVALRVGDAYGATEILRNNNIKILEQNEIV